MGATPQVESVPTSCLRQSHGFAGSFDLLFQSQGSRQIVLRAGVIRFEADGCLKLSDRLVNLALVEEDDSEVVVGVGVYPGLRRMAA